MKHLLFFLTVLLAGCQPTVPEAEVAAIRAYVAGHPGYNSQYAFYADLERPAGNYRFFVVDLETGKPLEKGLCLNGRTYNGQVLYSNEPGSNCSSRGFAKVSYSYTGRFGKAYKLAGLEGSNSNMFRRAVVLHSWAGVPDFPVGWNPVESEGCPTVSPAFLETLGAYIEASPEPVLLYIP
jgi:hypothetical protein